MPERQSSNKVIHSHLCAHINWMDANRVIFLIAVTFITGTVAWTCPDGFGLRDNGICYRSFKESKNWTDARQTCRQHGSDLIKVDEESTAELVNEIMSGSILYWIGLTDLLTENHFFWLDGSSITTERWRDNQPNGNTSENCVIARSDSIQWADRPCRGRFDFICERRSDLPHEVSPTQTAVALKDQRLIQQQHILDWKHVGSVEECARCCLENPACDTFRYGQSDVAFNHSETNCFLGFYGPVTSSFPLDARFLTYLVSR